MGILKNILIELEKNKQPKESNKQGKLFDLEKTIREMAKARGLMPRNFLIKIAEQNPKIAQNQIIQKLIGEQDVPTQKGRDAKPEVLTKRAMNVVKKQIKKDANKERRRMDKDAVGEDVKDQFTKLINPMGQDSTSLEKIKQSPGFHELISTMFASGTQADMDWDEIFSAMSKMLNMNPIEIKAILQQDGMDFAEPDAAERFKQNMGATGFLGKGKSKTLNSMYEDEHQDRGYAQMIIQQHQDEYKKFMDTGDLMDAPTIYEKLFAYFSSSDADDMMPYGTQKARDGDPYVWLVDKLDELGLIIEEGNEFAQKVRQLKATGAKKGTKFKTSDGEEHTLEQVSKKTIDNFHTELDRLVHKYFGHSSDEKKEKVKEDDDKGEVMVGSYQTKHFDICPSATQLYKDIDVEDMDLAERSAKLHDTLFYMEKHAMEMKKAEPEYIAMMQNLADQIMAMAGMMGLESEHSYVQGHVDAVKDLNEAIAESKAITEQEFDEAAGKKDACYHKVKARYKVWPSAYASGALVQCRKKGAANWGNKSK